MHKISILQLWNELYGTKEQVYDYAGRLMMKSACGNPYSKYQPTVDHIRPVSDGGRDIKENVVICHYSTNEEKADSFPHWKANGRRFHAVRKKGIANGYTIKHDDVRK